jgi:putative transposase
VRRLIGELGLQRKVYCKENRTTNSSHPFPHYPNLVQDLEGYIQTNFGGGHQLHKASLGVYPSSYASECVNSLHSGWDLGRSLNQELTQVTLQTALIQHTPGIHHSEQRVQYAATAYVQLLEETGVQISMAEMSQA